MIPVTETLGVARSNIAVRTKAARLGAEKAIQRTEQVLPPDLARVTITRQIQLPDIDVDDRKKPPPVNTCCR